MHVGVIGSIYPDSFAENIASGLAALGESVHRLGPAIPRRRSPLLTHLVATAYHSVPGVDERFQRSLVARARELELDIVITVEAGLHPTVITELRRGGTKTCLWYPDHIANLEREWIAVAPYDALFFKEPVLVNRFSRILDLPVYYLPEACNPQWHRVPDFDDPDPCDADGHVVVAGNIYGTRARLLSLLLDADVPLKIYGSPIPRRVRDDRIRAVHTGRYITRAEKARVFRRAAAVLSSMHPGEIEGVNARLFEATGSGGAVLTEFRSEVPKFFEPGSEVLTFASLAELLDHLKELFASPAAGRALGDAATVRAHAEHTYQDRLSRLLEAVA